MTCRILDIGDSRAIVCTRGERPRRCRCGARVEFLCDHIKRSGRTCDRPLCASCAAEVGEDAHLCPDHCEAARQGDLGL